jgi:uncharacterized iron-regulated protein
MTVRLLALAALAVLTNTPACAQALPGTSACGQPGQWLLPPAATSQSSPPSLAPPELLDRLAGVPVVLLGERHDRADDHHWQLDVLTALHQRHPDLAIGFEMFPRRLQGVLDQWVAGRLTEAEFLQQTDWNTTWGFDAKLYLPLFRFAREHHLPMLALNVDRELVRQVRAAGWEGAPVYQREGVGHPAPPAPTYMTELKMAFESHPAWKGDDPTASFNHFVEAQTVWDRAMAEAIARYRHDHPATQVVSVLGAGHIRNGYGVPHQLQALGADYSAKLMTLPSDHDCAELTPGVADAVYLIPPQADEHVPPPRLGVGLGTAANGVLIEMVMPGSLAESSGLKKGDVVLQAAGAKVSGIEDVRSRVQQQPPGTWLPLSIERNGQEQEIVVRFPVIKASSPPAESR